MADVVDSEVGFDAVRCVLYFFGGELDASVEDERGDGWVGGCGPAGGEVSDGGERAEVEGCEEHVLLGEFGVDGGCGGRGVCSGG